MESSFEGFTITSYKYNKKNRYFAHAFNDSNLQPYHIQGIEKSLSAIKYGNPLILEFNLLKQINHRNIAKPVNLIDKDRDTFLLFKDNNEVLLSEYLQQIPLDIKIFFELAFKLVETLHFLHQKKIVVRNLSADSILLALKTKEIRFFDLGNCISTQELFIKPEKIIENINPYYMAPEQSGLLDHGVDLRADIYSLGVLFYQMVTGAYPFRGEDESLLIYAHLNNQYFPINTYTSEVPKQIENIIYQCIHKFPEDRYQDAYLLYLDLVKAYQNFFSIQINSAYAVTLNSTPEFRLSEKMAGRKKEVDRLINVCNNNSDQSVNYVLVTGNSGMGKTKLVKEMIQHQYKNNNNLFLSSTSDRTKKEKPYFIWSQIFKNILEQVHNLGNKHSTNVSKMTKLLEKNDNYIVNYLQESKSFLKKPNNKHKIYEGYEANKFAMILYRLVKIIQKMQMKLTFIIDEFQWADTASIKILEILSKNFNLKKVLFVLIFDKEKLENNPSASTYVDFICSNRSKVEWIKLRPLLREDYENYLDDMCKISAKNIFKIYQYTHGNPFDLKELIKYLYRKQHVHYSQASLQWKIKIKKETLQYPPEKIFRDNLLDLPPETVEYLRIGSLLGTKFCINEISEVFAKSNLDVFKQLLPAMNSKVVFIKSPTLIYEDNIGKLVLNFFHEKYKEFYENQLESHQRRYYHFLIANSIAKNIKLSVFKNKLFKIVQHYNNSKTFANNESNRKILLLNFYYGLQKMKIGAAHEAYSSFNKANAILGKSGWQRMPYFKAKITYNQAKSAYDNLDYVTAEHLCKEALLQVTSVSLKLKFYSILIKTHHAQGKLKQGYELALKALSLARIQFPHNPNRASYGIELGKLYFNIKFHGLGSLKNKKSSENDVFSQAVAVMIDALPTFYAVVEVKQMMYIGLTLMNLMFKNGLTKFSPIIYMSYCVIFITLRDFDTAFKLSDFALDFTKKNPHKDIVIYTHAIYNAFVLPWKNPLPEVRETYLKTYKKSENLGAYTSCFLSIYWFSVSLKYSDRDILDEIKLLKVYKDKLIKINEKYIYQLLNIHLQYLNNLKTPKNKPWIFNGPYVFQKKLKRIYKNRLSEHKVYEHLIYHKFLLALNFGRYKIALTYANEIKMLEVPREPGSIENIYAQSKLIICICNYVIKYKENAQYLLKKIGKNLNFLKKISKINPKNIKSFYYIAQAEHLAALNVPDKPIQFYELAIKSAQEMHMTNEEAFYNELAGKFYLGQKNEYCATYYYIQAVHLYKSLNIMGKVDHLMSCHGAIISGFYNNLLSSDYSKIYNRDLLEHDTIQKNIFTNANNILKLDLISLIKLSSDISRELKLDQLLIKIVKILSENVGADVAHILLFLGNKLSIECSYDRDTGSRNVLQSLPYDQSNEVPRLIIDYIRRKQQSVIISNPANNKKFKQDAYFLTHNPASVLGVPIIHKASQLGIIYFENQNLSEHFTQANVDFIQTLTPQIAIAVENSRLYHSFKRFVPNKFLKLLEKKSILDVYPANCIKLNVTILFIQIKNFTVSGDFFDSKKFVTEIGEFYSSITSIINTNNGLVDKYIGDTIMVIFPTCAEDALTTAHEILSQSNQKYNYKMKWFLSMAIHTGAVMLGVLGTNDHLDGTVISDVVNTAARIQALNNYYNTEVLISGDSVSSLVNTTHYALRKIDKVILRGKTQSIEIWQSMPLVKNHRRSQYLTSLSEFNTAYALYYKKNFMNAILAFESLIKKYGDDKVYRILLKRCKKFLVSEQGFNPDGSVDAIIENFYVDSNF